MNLADLSQDPFSGMDESDMDESDMDESDMDESPGRVDESPGRVDESPGRVDESSGRVYKNFSRRGQQNTSPSPTPSEAFLNRPPKRSLNPTTNEPNGPNGPNDTDSSNYTKKPTAKQSVQGRRFSVTSDHKPVFMKFFLREIPLVALTYNMSFASDLGLTAEFQSSPAAFPFSEAYFVAQNKDDDTRLYWKNAAKLVLYFVEKKKPNIMFFQEMNDRDQIKIKDFDGGYQALVELLAKSITSSSRIPTSPTGSYYTTGIYVGKDEKNYGFLAYSIKKGNTFPTLLTIWDTDTLGGFSGFYGNDLGSHQNYKSPDGRNLGRNFSCVITRKGVILINLHGPNVESYMKENDQRLAPAITDFIGQAHAKFVSKSEPLLEFDKITYKSNSQIIFDETLVVIGGDTNDTLDKVKQIPFGNAIYKFEGEAPRSCCAEYYNDVLVGSDGMFKPYKYCGDKIYVHYTEDQLGQYPQIFQNQLVIETIPELLNPPEPSLEYGGRRHSRNLKKKKLLKKKKTIKKRHYKLKNKKSLNKRRMFRRKTRKHTHKQ